MTARFGRNKRRRAREAIAALTAHEAELLALRAADTRRLHNVSCQVLALEQEIRQAKAIAGPMSILFPASRRQECGSLNPPRHFDVHMRTAVDRFDAALRFERLRLNTLVARVSRDWLDRHVHLYLTFDDMDIAYAVAEDSLAFVPEHELSDYLMNQVAPLLVQAIADGLVKRRRVA